MKFYLSIVVAALCVGGCSSVGHDAAYRGEAGTAFVLIAEDGSWDAGKKDFVYRLRPLNAAKNAFEKGSQSVAFFDWKVFPSSEFTKPDTLNTPLRLAGLRVPAGDYALTTHFSRGYTEQGNTSFVTCFSLGAAVFRLQEGVINVIHTSKNHDHPLLDAETTKADVAAFLAEHPKMTAPVVHSTAIGSVTFQTSKNILGNDTCEPDGPLAFKPRFSP